MAKKKGSVTKNRSIYYYRCCFHPHADTTVNETLEEMITRSWSNLNTTQKRTFLIDNGKSVVGMKIDTDTVNMSGASKDCTLFTVGLYEAGAAANIIPVPSDGTNDLEASTQSAPQYREFLDAEGFACIYGNHLIFSPADVLRVTTMNKFIEKLLFEGGYELESNLLDIKQIANLDSYKTLMKEGVKDITLNASLYLETLNHHERTNPDSTQSTILKRVTKLAKSCLDVFKDDESDDDLENGESLNSKILLSHDGRVKGEGSEADNNRLMQVANSLLDADLSGYVITTKKHNKLTHDSIILKKEVKVTAHGKSVVGTEMWVKLVDTLSSYDKDGTLEQ